jgi:hypothetical protein
MKRGAGCLLLLTSFLVPLAAFTCYRLTWPLFDEPAGVSLLCGCGAGMTFAVWGFAWVLMGDDE